MIPAEHIANWRATAPWFWNEQVEQDLVLSRALIEIYSHPVLAKGLAFRGGTALHKLYINPPGRYSEDIDFVQTIGEPSGSIMGALREVLNPWLGKARWKQTRNLITFYFRFQPNDLLLPPSRVKVEINTRENLTTFGYRRIPFTVSSGWFNGTADVLTYTLDEFLATKLRALYQRKRAGIYLISTCHWIMAQIPSESSRRSRNTQSRRAPP